MSNPMATSKDLRPPRGSRTIAKTPASKNASGSQARSGSGGLIKKLRKPIPPPTRIIEDEHKYNRARERERSRRAVKELKATKTEGTPDDRV
jgi:hypothetical protein